MISENEFFSIAIYMSCINNDELGNPSTVTMTVEQLAEMLDRYSSLTGLHFRAQPGGTYQLIVSRAE